jgi:hypothetical protein
MTDPELLRRLQLRAADPGQAWEARERLRRRREVEEAEPYNRGICRYCEAAMTEPHNDDCEWEPDT